MPYHRRIALVAVILCVCLGTMDARGASTRLSVVTRQELAPLAYDTLCRLATNPHPSPLIDEQVYHCLHTPFISNEAYARGVIPHQPYNAALRSTVIRIASWHITRSLTQSRFAEVMRATTNDLVHFLDTRTVPLRSARYWDIVRQRDRLLDTDIVIVQGIESGMKRSSYRNGAEELATLFGMNVAYVPEFITVDPVILGLMHIRDEDKGTDDLTASAQYAADPRRYQGLTGNAVLSRYPITHVEVRTLAHQAYDWYSSEQQRIAFFDRTHREENTRSIRVGGRHFFRVDLHVPDIPGQVLTVINVHLERNCSPEAREEQLAEILSYMRDIRTPVILMGNFNAADRNLAATSFKQKVTRTVRDPMTWISATVNQVTPYGLAITTSRTAVNFTKNFDNPLAPHIPLIAPNHLKGMFSLLSDFCFNDGGAFDFRGDDGRSINHQGACLSNSNEHDRKGYATTFHQQGGLTVRGKYRLDWAFVKPPVPQMESVYLLAPHFGETLEAFNRGLTEPLSDHHPNVLDLPLEEPKIN